MIELRNPQNTSCCSTRRHIDVYLHLFIGRELAATGEHFPPSDAQTLFISFLTKMTRQTYDGRCTDFVATTGLVTGNLLEWAGKGHEPDFADLLTSVKL